MEKNLRFDGTDHGPRTIEKGSEASISTSTSMSEGWINLREKLKKNEILVEADGKLVFQEDAVFTSTSAAASVVLGRQANGLTSWVDENRKTFKSYEEDRIRTGELEEFALGS